MTDGKHKSPAVAKYGVSAPHGELGTFVYGVHTPSETAPDLEIKPYANPWPPEVFEGLAKPAAFELLADERARVAALRAAVKFAVKCLSTDAETATPVVEALKQVLEDTQ